MALKYEHWQLLVGSIALLFYLEYKIRFHILLILIKIIHNISISCIFIMSVLIIIGSFGFGGSCWGKYHLNGGDLKYKSHPLKLFLL